MQGAPAGLEPDARGGLDEGPGDQPTGASEEIGAFLEGLDGEHQRAVAVAGREEDGGMMDGPERRWRTPEEDGVGPARAERDGDLGGHDGRSRLGKVGPAGAPGLDEA